MQVCMYVGRANIGRKTISAGGQDTDHGHLMGADAASVVPAAGRRRDESFLLNSLGRGLLFVLGGFLQDNLSKISLVSLAPSRDLIVHREPHPLGVVRSSSGHQRGSHRHVPPWWGLERLRCGCLLHALHDLVAIDGFQGLPCIIVVYFVFVKGNTCADHFVSPFKGNATHTVWKEVGFKVEKHGFRFSFVGSSY